MALLKELIVTGASRFLNKVYCQEIDASSLATGTLSASGAATLSSTLSVAGTAMFTKTTDLSGTANNKPAVIIGGTDTQSHIEIDANEIQAKTNGTSTAALYINTDGGTVYLSNGTKISAADGTLTATSLVGSSITSNGTISSLGNITCGSNIYCDSLMAKYYDLQTVYASSGGSLLLAPTKNFPTASTTNVQVTKSGDTCTITITDSSIVVTAMSGVVWNTGCYVKASGVFDGIQSDTMEGTITNISNGSMGISVSGGNAANIAAGTYGATATASVKLLERFSVILYKRVVNGVDYRYGILLDSYNTSNNSPVIDVYSGTNDSDSLSTPTIRMGNINGLQYTNKDNQTTTLALSDGWGFYAKGNAYIEGHIVANSGRIANWSIDDNLYYVSSTPSASSITLSPAGKQSSTSIGGSSGINTWAFTVKDIFGVTNEGRMYCTGGKIGGWNITGNAIYSETTDVSGIKTITALQNSILDQANCTNCIASADNNSIMLYAIDDGDMKFNIKFPTDALRGYGYGVYNLTITFDFILHRGDGVMASFSYGAEDSDGHKHSEGGSILFNVFESGHKIVPYDLSIGETSNPYILTKLGVNFSLDDCLKNEYAIIKFTLFKDGVEIPIGWEFVNSTKVNSGYSFAVQQIDENDNIYEKFYISNSGKIFSNDCEIVGGEIGKWKVNKNAIYSETTDANGMTTVVALQNSILDQANCRDCIVSADNNSITIHATGGGRVLADVYVPLNEDKDFNTYDIEVYFSARGCDVDGATLTGYIYYTNIDDSNIPMMFTLNIPLTSPTHYGTDHVTLSFDEPIKLSGMDLSIRNLLFIDEYMIVKFKLFKNGVEIPIDWEYKNTKVNSGHCFAVQQIDENDNIHEKFYISNSGSLFCQDAEYIGIRQGSIAGFHVASSGDLTHRIFTNSMFHRESIGTTYEYELGLTSDGWANNYYGIYVKRIPQNSPWGRTKSEDMFYVKYDGKVYCSDITIDQGKLSGFVVTNSANTGTTADGGHCMTNSIYSHSSNSSYEYEFGLQQNDDPNTLGLYVKRIPKGSNWSNGEDIFFIKQDGTRSSDSAWALLNCPSGTTYSSTVIVNLPCNPSISSNGARYFQSGTNSLTIKRTGAYFASIFCGETARGSTDRVTYCGIGVNTTSGYGPITAQGRMLTWSSISNAGCLNLTAGDVITMRFRDESNSGTIGGVTGANTRIVLFPLF